MKHRGPGVFNILFLNVILAIRKWGSVIEPLDERVSGDAIRLAIGHDFEIV